MFLSFREVFLLFLNEYTCLGPVHINAFSKECVSINSRPHYRFDAFSTVHTKTLENDRIARCDVS